jgi:hypothetical protein
MIVVNQYLPAMKKTLMAASIVFASLSCYAQKEIAIDSVKSNIGQDVKVCADFYGMKETEKVTLINVGDAYPQSPLTIVIYAKDKDKFKDMISTFKRERTSLCASGIITEFKGKLQIAIEKVEQLQSSYKKD